MGKMYPFLWSGSPFRSVTKKSGDMGQPKIIGLRRLTATLLIYLDTWIAMFLPRYVASTIHIAPARYIYISNEPCLSVNLCLFAGFAFEFMVGSKVAMLENCQTSLKS